MMLQTFSPLGHGFLIFFSLQLLDFMAFYYILALYKAWEKSIFHTQVVLCLSRSRKEFECFFCSLSLRCTKLAFAFNLNLEHVKHCSFSQFPLCIHISQVA